MKRSFTFLIAAMALMIATMLPREAWADSSFSTTYSYGGVPSTWGLTNFDDKGSYYLVPKSTGNSLASFSGIFTGKTITSDVVITINCATFGSGNNPTASTFSIYSNADCTSSVTAAQGGTLPTSNTFTDVTYTVTQANAAAFTNDLGIKITKPGKQIRLKSVKVEFTYTTTGGSGPSISCSNITNVPYEGVTDAETTVTFTNATGWTPSISCDGTIVTTASLSESTVTYSVSENTGNTDRTGSFIITLSKSGETDVTKVVSVTQNHLVVDYAELPFSYDGGNSNLPAGLTQNGLGSDYSSSPKMKFDGTGDYVILKINENPGTLRYTIRGNGFSGSTFKLQTSVDGETYTDKKTYTTLGDAQNEVISDLDASVRYIKWIYTKKSSGNVALGAISLAKEGVKIPTFSVPAGNYYASQSVTLSQTNSKPIYYTTNGDNPTENGTLYTSAIPVTSTCTIKAAALDDTEWSEVVSATYQIAQTYNSVAAVNAITDDDIPIIVSMNNWTITSISGYNMYVNDGTSGDPTPTIHIYDYYIPNAYSEGGTLTGSLKAVWDYDYDEVKTIQNWGEMNYSAPTFAINIDDELENGSITTVPSTEASAGTTVTLTVTPASGYRMVTESLIIIDDSAEEVEFTGSNPYTFTMPESDVEISAEFELIPSTTYSYLYSVNGLGGSETEVAEGTIITLAAGSDYSANFPFAGWTTDESDVENLLAAGSNYTIDEDVIFYAVYSHTTGAVVGSGNFEKVTTNLTDWTGKYLLIFEGAVVSGEQVPAVAWTGVEAANCGSEVTITDGVISAQPEGSVSLTIATMTNGYSIMVNGGDNNGKYIYGTSGSNGISFGNTASLNTISYENECVSIVSNTSVLRYNASSGQYRFRYFKSTTYGSQKAIQLYKKDEGTPGTTHYYTRVFNETATAAITIAGPSIIPAGSTLNMGSYALTNTTASNLVIEDGAQLIHSNAGVAATVKKSITGYNGGSGNYYLIAAPMVSAVSTSGIAIGTYDLYAYDEVQALWLNAKQEGSTFDALNPQQGYLYANNATQEVSMAGTLNPSNEAMSYELSYARDEEDNFKGFNLVGNPFACNAYANTAYYVMNGNGDAFVPTESSVAIQPGQAILVQATALNQSVTFSKNAPEMSNNLSLNVSNQNGLCDRAILSFNEGKQLGKFVFNENNFRLSLNQNGKDYAVSSVEEEGEIPVCFKAPVSGNYTISVNTENLNVEYLHLIDNMTGADIDLLVEESYSFSSKTTDYASRFKLVFKANAQNDEMNEVESSFAYISNGELIISNEGRATLQVIDMMGRVLNSQSINGDCRISVNGMTAGVYVLNLNGKTQKIVVR